MARERIEKKYIIGIDEAGRGPLAGPISVGVFCAEISFFKKIKKMDIELRDSKKLSPNARDRWFSEIIKIQRDDDAYFAQCFSSEKIIDEVNVSKAGNLAVGKAVENLFNKLDNNSSSQFVFLLDAGLKIDIKNSKNIILKKVLNKSKIKSIIKGDEKESAISLASIIAKVSRDKYMLKMAKKYPEYGFEKHKGYGTKEHIENIKKHGASPIHRKSFLKNIKID